MSSIKLSRGWLGGLAIVGLLTLVALPARTHQGGADSPSDLAAWIRASYTKFEYRIPMRDGVKLFTAVYMPKDATVSRTYPILLMRTPYGVGPYGVDIYPARLGPSELFARSKYIFVNEDVRSTMMSEGEFVNVRPIIPNKTGTETDESSDAYDTVAWLLRISPPTTAKWGFGVFDNGFYAAAAMIDAHPAVRAVSPQAPVADWFIGDDFHHNGALWLPHLFNFISSFWPAAGGPDHPRAKT